MRTFKVFLTEGGNAVDVASRINQRNAAATLEEIYKKILPAFKMTKKDTDKYTVLGSAGKKKDDDSSGDIDLALDVNHIQKVFKLKTKEDTIKKIQDIVTEIASKLHKEYGHDGQFVKDFFKLMPGLLTFSIGFPINNTDGKQDGLFVQLDLMPVENVEYAGWAMGAPSHEQSNVKAVVRNVLLSMIVKHSDMKVLDKDENGDPVSVERFYLDLKSGLYRATQARQMGKSGKYTKQSKIIEKKLITANKQKIIDMFFKGNHKASDVITFEKLWELFNGSDFKYPSKRDEIKERFLESMQEMKIEIPKIV